MKINKIMVASLLLLAILTLGAVSASDNLTASETPDTLELGVGDADILVDGDDGDEIDDEPMYDERDRQDPEMNITFPEDINVGEFFTVEVKLPEDAEGSVEYNYNISGEGFSSFVSGESEVYDGEARLYPQITYLTDVVLNIEYSGDYKYNSASQSIPISFDKSDYIFEINSGIYSIDYNYNSFLDILVPDNFNGILTVVINGKQYSIGRDEESEDYGFDSSILHYGENDVTVSYGGDDVFAEKSFNATLNVISYFNTPYYITFGSSNVEVLKLPEDATGNITLYAEVEDESGWNEIVIATGTVKNGIGTVDFSNLDIGEYGDYSLRYEGNYPEVEDYLLFFLIEPKIDIPSVIFKGEEAYVAVELPEGMEGTLKVIDVIESDGDIILDSNDIGSAQFVDSVAKVSLSELEIGDYSIQLRCDDINWERGFHVYVVNSTDLGLDIVNYLDEILVGCDDSQDLRINVPEYLFANITVLIDDEIIESFDINDDAEHSLYVEFYVSDLEVGNHNLTINVTSDKFQNKTYVEEFEVVSAYIYIPEHVYVHEDFEIGEWAGQISVDVNDDATGTIQVFIDGELIDEIEIDEDESDYGFEFRGLSTEAHDVEVIYSGDDKYPGRSKTAVTNISYLIDVYPKSFIYGDDEVEIIIDPPLDIGEGELTATIDGIEYELEEADGKFMVHPDDLSIGTHEMIVKYSGDEVFLESEFNNTISIIAIPHIPNYWAANEDVHLILPSDAKGSLILSIMTWDEEYESTSVVDEEIPLVDGRASYSLDDLPFGEYDIIASYSGDDYDVWNNEDFFRMQANIYFDKSDESLPINETKTVYIETPGYNGTLHVLIKKASGYEWDDDVEDYVSVYTEIISTDIDLVDYRTNYTISDFTLGEYYVEADFIVEGEQLSYDNMYFTVVPIELDIPDPINLNDMEPIWVLMPEDCEGEVNVNITHYYWDDNYEDPIYEYIDTISASFEDGEVSIDLPELDEGRYIIEVNITTTNYGDYYTKYYVHAEYDEDEDDEEGNGLSIYVDTQKDYSTDENSPDADNAFITVYAQDGTEYHVAVFSSKKIFFDKNLTDFENAVPVEDDEEFEGYWEHAISLRDVDFLNGLDEVDKIWIGVYKIEDGYKWLDASEEYVVFFNDDSTFSLLKVLGIRMFYGNLTSGETADGMISFATEDFINIEIPESADVHEMNVTVDYGGETRTYSLSDFKVNEPDPEDEEFDGYTYYMELTDEIKDLIRQHENETITFNFTYEYKGKTVSASFKRILKGEIFLQVVSISDLYNLFDFNIADDVLVDSEEEAVRIFCFDSNWHVAGNDWGGGYFKVYVDDNEVKTYELFSDLVHGGIIEAPRFVSLSVSDLGITAGGTYNIKITHLPDPEIDIYEDDETGELITRPCYIVVEENELISKVISVDFGDLETNSTIEVDDIEFVYGESGSANITLVGANDIVANVVGHEANVTFENGTITVSGLDAGNYTLNITTVPEEGYIAVSKLINITVNKADSSVSVSDVEFYLGDRCDADVVLVGATGVTARIINSTVAPVVNGTKVTVSGLDAGTYTLEVTTVPDANHNAVTGTATITVNKVDSSVDISDVEFDYGSSGCVEVFLTDSTGFTARIINSSVVPVVDGNMINISGLDAGTYTLEVTSVVDGNHNPDTATATITVNKVDSSVSVSDIAFDYGGNWSATANMAGATGVAVKIVNSTVAPVVDGSKITVSGLDAGTYTLEVTTVPDANHNAVTGTATITVNKVDSSVSVSDIAFDYGGSGSATVNMTGATGVTAKIVDSTVAPVVDGSKITVSGLAAGTYTLEVTTVPDANHNAATATANVVVSTADTVIVVNTAFSRYATDYYSDGTKDGANGERGGFFYATLYDVNGNPLVNKTVQIAINGPVYNVTTDENGKAGLQVNLAKANTYTYALYFPGDEGYSASLIASSKLTVVKKPTSIISNNKYVFKASLKTKTVTVALNTIKNPFDNKLYLKAGKKLTLTVNGKTYTAKTDSKGVAKFNIKLSKIGTFTATVKFAGDSTYESTSKSIKISISKSAGFNAALKGVGVGMTPKELVKPGALNIEGNYADYIAKSNISTSNVNSAKKDAIIVVNSSFTRNATDYSAGERGGFFYASLTDSNGNPLVNKTVQIAVNGPIYNVTTDKDGKAGLQVNLAKANTYTYALSFAGDDEYNPAMLASSKLTVIKKPITIDVKGLSFKAKAKTKTVTVKLSTIKNAYDSKMYLKDNKKVNLKVNGITYSGNIKNGVVTFNVKLTKKGTYAAVVSFDGDSTYESASKRVLIKIKA